MKRVTLNGLPPKTVMTKKLPDQVSGLVVRKSNRWIDVGPDLQAFDFPHFDRLGKHTGDLQGSFICNPQNFIATTVATVARKLRSHYSSHNKGKKEKGVDLMCVRTAFYFLTSRNSWLLDRFFALSRKGRIKNLKKTLFSFVSKMDDYNRFVYSQVCFQTHWLLFRAYGPRDKSINPVTSFKESRIPDFMRQKSFKTMRTKFVLKSAKDIENICGPPQVSK